MSLRDYGASTFGCPCYLSLASIEFTATLRGQAPTASTSCLGTTPYSVKRY